VTPIILIVALGLAISIILLFAGVAAPRSADQVSDRLVEYGGQTLTLEELELSQPFAERIMRPILRGMADAISRLSPNRNVSEIRRRLEMAGRPFGWGPTEFIGVRGLAAVVGLVLPFILMTITQAPLKNRLIFPLLLGALGYFAPVLWLRGKITRRQKEIVRSLPDALDLLTVSVEAGLGFDAALAKVAEKWDNQLSRAFGRVIHEIRIGKLRREALRDMADNMDVPDVTSFVAAIIQADQLGVSLSKILRIQSEQMRIKRRQRAEELAHKAPIKMLIPMVFLIFPAIYIILLGPAVLVLLHSGVFGAGLAPPPPGALP
jgi:tight adherence protein C